MNGIAGLAVLFGVVFFGPRMILALYSAAFKKRRREARAKQADKLWGYFAVAGAIVLLSLAGLEHIGLIEIK